MLLLKYFGHRQRAQFLCYTKRVFFSTVILINQFGKGLKMNSVVRVCAALLVREQKILIAQRGDTDPLAGRWEFPGGKVENGETPQQCLIRELKEELNLQISVGEQIGVHLCRYQHIHIELMLFRAEILNGRIKLNEHADYRWVNRRCLPRFEFCKADVYFVDKINGGVIPI